MKRLLPLLSTALLVLAGIPIVTVYRQNLETLSEEIGANRLLAQVFYGAENSPSFAAFLFAFVFLLGSTSGLWFHAWTRKFWEKPPATHTHFFFWPGKKRMFLQGEDIKKLLLIAGHDGEFHIYVRFKNPVETPYIQVRSSNSAIQWMERDSSDRSLMLSFKNMYFRDQLQVLIQSEKSAREGGGEEVRRQPIGEWLTSHARFQPLSDNEIDGPQALKLLGVTGDTKLGGV